MLRVFGQLGANLEIQDHPKSMPKPEKIDVETQHVFGIVFFDGPDAFWEAFW